MNKKEIKIKIFCKGCGKKFELIRNKVGNRMVRAHKRTTLCLFCWKEARPSMRGVEEK